jgi:hypothetical protein
MKLSAKIDEIYYHNGEVSASLEISIKDIPDHAVKWANAMIHDACHKLEVDLLDLCERRKHGSEDEISTNEG